MVDTVTLALNEPSTVTLIDDGDKPTGSLLGSLVIVARHRGVQLSKEQLIRDHLLKAGDATVAETIGIARDSGLRASATRLRWGDLFNMGTALPTIVLLRNGAAMVLLRTEVNQPGWPPFVVLRDPNGSEEALLVLDEARFSAAWDGDVILVKRDYRLRDEDRPFGMGWIAGQLLRDRRVARDLGVCAIILGVLAISPVTFWRVMIDRVMYYGSMSTFTMICLAFLIWLIF
jgi:subfamily B ATP-binding cassette protein HlyB/CyaB